MKIFVEKCSYLASLILIMMTFISSCKVNESPKSIHVTSEYVFTHTNLINHDEIKSVFGVLGAYTIKSSSSKMTLIKFDNDPGLEKLQLIIKESGLFSTVQPNYQYRKLN